MMNDGFHGLGPSQAPTGANSAEICRSCITRYLLKKSCCPQCEADLDPSNRTHLIPNHTAAALIENVKRTRSCALKRLSSNAQPEFGIGNEGTDVNIDNEDIVAKRRCERSFISDDQKKSVLLNEFFDQLIQDREKALSKLQDDLEQLRIDKIRANERFQPTQVSGTQRLVPEPSTSWASEIGQEQIDRLKKRVNPNINSLESCYFELKNETKGPPRFDAHRDHLDEFTEVLSGMSQYVEIKRLATLNYNIEASNNLSIVSSIEFDKDGDFFVVAGVTKKIKLYDYNAVVYSDSEIHYPLHQLQCSSKISNLSWNPYIKTVLASSDYDGKVQLWDTSVCRSVQTFREHEKRCWTVQFNNVDPHIMASGSDDAKVKIWSVNQMQSVCTVDARVNVCCVYFSPTSRNYFVFGSADHGVHLYDLRNTSRSVNVFRGHRKAVSYVKYCNENEVVSASTDSNLRLWDVKTGQCKRVMRGHLNEKNFVGLATDGNHIVCGSENNQLYMYYKNVADPLMKYNFTSRQADSEATEVALVASNEVSSSDFVSAVCWKKNSNVVVAANSQGTTHILQLQ